MAEGNIGTAYVEIGAKIDGLTSALQSVQHQLSNFETKTSKLADKMQTTGKMLSRNLTVPLLAIGAGAVKAFSDFDSAMTESTSIMGKLSDEQRKKLAAVAKAMSQETSFSAANLAQAYYFLASAGLTAEQSMAALPTVARFAQAGMFDLEKATELLADSQTALGLRSDDAAENLKNLTRVSDVLVDAANASNASVEQFAAALTNKAAGAMRLMNMEIEDGVAVLAAYADQGVKGEHAGESFSIVLRDLQNATNNNSRAWKDAGIQVYDSTGKMNSLSSIVRQLTDHLKPLSDQQQALAIKTLGLQDRSVAYTKVLLGMSDKIDQYAARLRKAGGVTEEVAKKQLESFKNQMLLARNSVVNSAAALGEKLAPAVISLARILAGAIQSLADMDGATRTVAIGLGVMAAALGPLLNMVGMFLKNMGTLKGALTGAAVGFSFIATQIGKAVDNSKKYLAALDELADMAGEERLSGFERFWQGLNNVFTKLTTGINTTTLATEALAKKQAELRGETEKTLNPLTLFRDLFKEIGTIISSTKPIVEDTGKALASIGDITKKISGGLALTKDELQKVKEEFDLTFKSDYSEKIKNLEIVLNSFGDQLPREKVKELKDELVSLKQSASGIEPIMKSVGYSFQQIDASSDAFEESEDKWRDMVSGIKDGAVTIDEETQSVYSSLDKIGLKNKSVMEQMDHDTKIATENMAKSFEEKMQKIQNIANVIGGALLSVISALIYAQQQQSEAELEEIERRYDAQMEALEKQQTAEQEAAEAEYERQVEAIKNSTMSEEEKNKALEELKAKHDEKMSELEKAQAAQQKALEEAKEAESLAARKKAFRDQQKLQLAQALVSGALAVVNAMATVPFFPLGLAMAGLAAASTAIQISTIKSTPEPMKEGGLILDSPTLSQDGKFLGGEAGPEAVLPFRRMAALVAPLVEPAIAKIVDSFTNSAFMSAPQFSAAGAYAESGSMDYAPIMRLSQQSSQGSVYNAAKQEAPAIHVYIGDKEIKDYISKTVKRDDAYNRLGIRNIR